VDANEKGSYIVRSEKERGIKQMRNKRTTGSDDVPEDVLKMLGEGVTEQLDK
jgi:hypothetical protein